MKIFVLTSLLTLASALPTGVLVARDPQRGFGGFGRGGGFGGFGRGGGGFGGLGGLVGGVEGLAGGLLSIPLDLVGGLLGGFLRVNADGMVEVVPEAVQATQ
jgi:hypothetical protein